ncbi:hypothetical protein BT96DRAFT_1010028 [Gymnopus androsaceus JB14]|uniref:Uncharacterized protein n=1 Tax=Gymnopus androsaceus JB14 TaxID=1447944 RepID=A0A6A4GBC1_9AGAR|nr:hypothetical protein BT96DRAFT_1010028 [Gymnopus androsaceus JB14]
MDALQQALQFLVSQSGQALLNQFSQQNQPATGSPSLSFSPSQAPPPPPLQPPVLSSQPANAALLPHAPQAPLPQAPLPQAPQAPLPQAQPLSAAGPQSFVPQQQSQPLAQLELQSSLPAPSQPSAQTETQVEGSSSYSAPSTEVRVIHPPSLSSSLVTRPPACQPYSSMQMLASVASNTSSGSQGHPRITTAPGFPALTAIQRSNQTRMEHASVSLPQSS